MSHKKKPSKKENHYTCQIWYKDPTGIGGWKRVNWKNCKLETMDDEEKLKSAIINRYPTATAANVYGGSSETLKRQIKIA
jgi:hypothetical protein